MAKVSKLTIEDELRLRRLGLIQAARSQLRRARQESRAARTEWDAASIIYRRNKAIPLPSEELGRMTGAQLARVSEEQNRADAVRRAEEATARGRRALEAARSLRAEAHALGVGRTGGRK